MKDEIRLCLDLIMQYVKRVKVQQWINSLGGLTSGVGGGGGGGESWVYCSGGVNRIKIKPYKIPCLKTSLFCNFAIILNCKKNPCLHQVTPKILPLAIWSTTKGGGGDGVG